MHWTAFGQSVVGTSHSKRNAPCQDAFCLQVFGPNDDWLAIAAADGAGSASYSAIGAALTASELVKRAVRAQPASLLTRDTLEALYGEVRNTLHAQAEFLRVAPRELASTAILAIVGPSSASFAQLGDGGIVVRQDSTYRLVFWPETSEYVNATDFLTDHRSLSAIRFERSDIPVLEIAVFTDGLQRLVIDYAQRAPYPGFFGPLFTDLHISKSIHTLIPPLRALLQSEKVNRRTDDDKTIVLAVRQP
ncbi:MAG: protein phosphatase 2C domain-containing protein [Gemmatales bacterium]|nr:protein phosphatase 2C domain-containing protein [Gemmatales bacterium]MDW8386904.1 PP2C family serine/threonine-protein phosphatase [Gemmatales bacterium]